MLAVGPGLAEHHRTGLALHRTAVAMDPLAIRFHLQLLQEGGQATQAVGIGRDRARMPPEAVDVPHLGQGHQHRRIALQRRRDEMLVHRPGTGQQAVEHLGPEGDDAGQADRRPQGIPPADPVPKGKGPPASECRCPLRGGRDPDEVLLEPRLGQGRRQPGLGRLGIGQGLLGRESLGHHDHQRRLGVQSGHGFSHVARIDVGHEPQVDRGLQRPQRIPHQPGAQVRPADADVDDGPEGLSRRPDFPARTHRPGIVGHRAAHLGHLGRHRLAQRVIVRALGRPQRRVQHRPTLGVVDRLAAEQPPPRRLNFGGPRQVQTGLEPSLCPALLGQVEVQSRRLDGHPRQPIGVDYELVDDARFAIAYGSGVEGGPGGIGLGLGHGSRSVRRGARSRLRVGRRPVQSQIRE